MPLDPITKARMELGLQRVPCISCVHGVKMDPRDYIRMWCTLLNAGQRKVGTCIPNTYHHFYPKEDDDAQEQG